MDSRLTIASGQIGKIGHDRVMLQRRSGLSEAQWCGSYDRVSSGAAAAIVAVSAFVHSVLLNAAAGFALLCCCCV